LHASLATAVVLGCGLAHAGEEPLAAMPPVSIVALHSELKFNLVAPARKLGEGASDSFMVQARRVVRSLQAAGNALYPESMRGIGTFDVFVADSQEIGILSSATGRIALNAGFADLKPTDDWLALVLAREMGHVIAGHHTNNSTASMVTSVLMNIVLPGSGLIKSAISFAGSQVAAVSGRERQTTEADEIAVKLLEAAGYTPRTVALSLALGPTDSQLGNSDWANTFKASAKSLLSRVRGGTEAPQAEARAPAPPAIVSTEGHLRSLTLTPAVRVPADELVLRTRPSGLPGPLLLGGNQVPPRRLE
jgi:hypothetical protein